MGLTNFRRLNDRRDILASFDSLVSLAIAQRKHVEAVTLISATDSLRDMFAFSRYKFYQSNYERNLATLHTDLDEQTFQSAWAEGQAMTQEQAVAYALEVMG
jgi:hypothetical protein